MSDGVSDIAGRVLGSRKYRDLYPPVVERLAEEALRTTASVKVASKLVKRKLHQIYGAFSAELNRERLAELIDRMCANPGEEREICGMILSMHASSAERLPVLDELYPPILQLARPRAILDIGCGLHPFCLPWMGLGDGVSYCAVDIDVELVRQISRYLAARGTPGEGLALDVSAEIPRTDPDLVLLMKMVPTLERQTPGRAAAIVAEFGSAWIAASFPRRSLGGRDRGMDEQYRRLAESVARGAGRDINAVTFPGETVFLFPPAS